MRRLGPWAALVCALTLAAPAPAFAQAAPDEPIRTVILAYDHRPGGTPGDYVRELDQALEELALDSGLRLPGSVIHELLGLADATVPPVLPDGRDEVVSLGFSVGVGLLGQPGVADQGGQPITTAAQCRAEFPDEQVLAFRSLRIGAREGFQCIRESRTAISRKLLSLAWIEVDDRRIATASQFGVIAGEDEIESIFAHSAAPAMRLFEAQADAVFVRLAPPP